MGELSLLVRYVCYYQAGVKDSVVLTEKMDAFWQKHNAEYAPYVSSR